VLKAELADKEKMLSQSDLSNLLSTYTQEIYFEKGRARLPEYAESRISDLAVFLKRYPDLQVRLIGYTDQSGPAAFNEQLSQARAVGVRDALHEQGVALERMIIESLGESMAKVEKGDQGNAILDRRVAIHLDQGVTDELLSNQEEIVESVESIVDTALAEWMN
jgi:outer membrane protein OmpA-like peptidoglycan-associated protein